MSDQQPILTRADRETFELWTSLCGFGRPVGQQLLFARWLVRSGRLSEWPAPAGAPARALGLPAAPADRRPCPVV